MRSLSLTLFAVLVLAATAFGQAKYPVSVSATGPKEAVAAGTAFEVMVELAVDSPYHIYDPGSDGGEMLDPVRTAVSGTADRAGVRFLGAEFPDDAHDLTIDYGGGQAETYQVLSGDVQVKTRFAVDATAQPGRALVTLKLDYMACDDRSCYPPRIGETITVPVEISAGDLLSVGLPSGDSPKTRVAVEAKAPTSAVAAGTEFAVNVVVRVAEDYHIYAHDSEGEVTRTKVTGASTDGRATFLGADYPGNAHDLTMDFGGGLSETYQVWDGAFVVRARFLAAADASPGPAQLDLRVDYQACDDRSCDQPVIGQAHTATVQIAPGDGAVTAGTRPPVDRGAATTTSTATPGRGTVVEGDVEGQLFEALSSGDVGGVIIASILAAFLALLTPCVFPMIPITVSFFTKRAEASGGKGAMRFAFAYGLGIIATYTGFGLLLALVSAGAAQGFATNPWVNIAVGGLFVFFGFSLLGFYDLRPPRFLTRAAEGGMGAKQGYLPVFAMGFVFTITAFTCTAPVVGGLLAGLTTSAHPELIVIGMLSFSTAFALPFVLLALFPRALSSMPGAGGWMVTVKVAMGFVELIAALKFFSNADIVFGLELMPRPTMLLATVMLTAALTLYLFGAYRLPHDLQGSKRRVLSMRTIFAVALLLMTLYLSRGLVGRNLDSWTEAYLPPHNYGVADGSRRVGVPWRGDLQSALAEAQTTGKNVFVDFTGITCVNCRQVEKKIFESEEFIQASRGVVPAQLYTDRRDRATGELREGDAWNLRFMEERFGTVTLPLYVLLAPDGTELKRMTYPARLRIEPFIDFIEGPIE